MIEESNRPIGRQLMVSSLIVIGASAVWFLWPSGDSQGETSSTTGQEGSLVLLHAGSLTQPFLALAKAFEEHHPRVKTTLESAGSRHCARKIAELDRRVDVFGSADYKVVENLLVPDHVRFNIHFATNDMVIAFGDHSRRKDELTEENWYRVLSDEQVRFGRSDPNSDPCGYRSLMVFQLAERHYDEPGLADRLTAMHGRTYIRPKETDLIALLEAGEIDYLPIYRSVAEQHGLTYLRLPAQVNLGDPDLGEVYRHAEVTVSGKTPGSKIVRRGEPIVYSITIPNKAPNPLIAESFVELLLSAEGQAILAKNGQPPLRPVRVTGRDALPSRLTQLLSAGAER